MISMIITLTFLSLINIAEQVVCRGNRSLVGEQLRAISSSALLILHVMVSNRVRIDDYGGF